MISKNMTDKNEKNLTPSVHVCGVIEMTVSFPNTDMARWYINKILGKAPIITGDVNKCGWKFLNHWYKDSTDKDGKKYSSKWLVILDGDQKNRSLDVTEREVKAFLNYVNTYFRVRNCNIMLGDRNKNSHLLTGKDISVKTNDLKRSILSQPLLKEFNDMLEAEKKKGN